MTPEPEAVPPVFRTARGRCQPLGATPRSSGLNFAVFSRHATRVSLVLFRGDAGEPLAEIPLDPSINKTGDIWHILVYGLTPDIAYAYRVHGPLAPEAGHRFDPRFLLIDPYAPDVSGASEWGGMAAEPRPGVPMRAARRSRVLLDDYKYSWEGDVPLSTPMGRTVIYELHVRGFTRHPSSGVLRPGTFSGLCEKLPYLKALGVTAVQLMPALDFDELDQVHSDPATGQLLKNYWGYSPVSFFAPKASYAHDTAAPVREFKDMVKRFHQEGIEVILDVVYNHTCEGDERGPNVCFRGLDNSIYYMLDRRGRYYNFSGCGNTVNCNHPVVRDLIINSLTYLVDELHVDGFRFDLAAILGRGPQGEVLADPPLIRHIAEHPVLAGVKLIAEAWDAAGLTQLGKFPVWGRWAELNGVYRDDARRFIRSEAGATSAISKRICGSLDIYGDSARHPYHSVNFITCHDGFTLNDLVSYNHKHNLANGEEGRDGAHDDLSYNCGHEGPTDDFFINATRQRQIRNCFVLLLTSQGVPLLLQGDELGRTQRGNNNAYCQDNEISWVDWSLAERNAGLLRFVRMMIGLRRRHFALTREEFCNRVAWHGTRVGDPDWTGKSRTLAFTLHGWHGEPDIYVMFNTHWDHQRFNLPPVRGQWNWRRLVDTNLASPEDIVEQEHAVPLQPADHYVCVPRSAVILISPR